MSQKEQYQLLREHFHDLPNIMMLVCGLTQLKSQDDFQFILYQLSTGRDEFGAINDHVLLAVKCICESQRIPSPAHAKSPFELFLSQTTPHPYDCLCISYTICQYPIVELDMSWCNIGDKGVVTLSQWCVKKITQLQGLDLYSNDLSSMGIFHLERIIKSKLYVNDIVYNTVMTTGSPSLRALDVGGNEIGDIGVELLCKELQSNNLTHLRIWGCGLSVKGSNYRLLQRETMNLLM